MWDEISAVKLTNIQSTISVLKATQQMYFFMTIQHSDAREVKKTTSGSTTTTTIVAIS
jgi:hypothetical protein